VITETIYFFKSKGITDTDTTRLFHKLTVGVERRIGRLAKQNRGIAVDVSLEISSNYEIELFNQETLPERKREIILFGAANVIKAGLRDGKVLCLVDASELM
jgi:hypothetical protein